MELSIKFVSTNIVELTCTTNSTTVTEDIANSNGKISESFIEQLEDILFELKEHNKNK